MDDFEDTFDRHEIRSSIVQENFGSWLLMRRHPPDRAGEDGGFTGHFWVRITAADGLLRVSGDFAPIIFQGHLGHEDCPIGRVAWMGGHPFLSSYVCEKARIGSGREACTTWNVDHACEDLREMMSEREQELEAEAREEYGDDPAEWPDDELCCSSLLAMQEGIDTEPGYDGQQGVHQILEAIRDCPHELEMENVYQIGKRASSDLKLAHRAVMRLHVLLEAEEAARVASEEQTP